jgi:hypothetical protein
MPAPLGAAGYVDGHEGMEDVHHRGEEGGR